MMHMHREDFQVKKQCRNQIIYNTTSHQTSTWNFQSVYALLGTKDKWQVTKLLDRQWAHSIELDNSWINSGKGKWCVNQALKVIYSELYAIATYKEASVNSYLES